MCLIRTRNSVYWSSSKQSYVSGEPKNLRSTAGLNEFQITGLL